ncbi:DUF2057 domain-containing protein [Vibrio metschnikovii]|uniref:YccT family protein n=1 Tax=Vibrio metschnikovii TaxID=28172 RepID=UPI001C30FD06|nr:DUF2057 domain-containing protein [Vibrio metschnikovii]
MNKFLISALLGMVVSSHAYADVMVNIDRDLQILAINGVEADFPFGHTSELVLPNGLNQLLVRMEKVIQYSGTQNKYKSPAIVLSFAQENSQVFLKPARLVQDETTSKEFDRKPEVLLTNSSQRALEFQQDVLAPKGFSVFRNYEKELFDYNAQDKIAAVSAPNHQGFNQQRSQREALVSAELVAVVTAQTPVTHSKSTEMVHYLFGEANSAERQEFANWAFANRAEVNQLIVTQSKLVEMMADWYQKADKTEKSSILSWLISQE